MRFYNLSDKRSENYFLVSKPPTLWALILVGYVILVKLGPKLMENRKPFEFKILIIIYNIFQIIANAMIVLVVKMSNFASNECITLFRLSNREPILFSSNTDTTSTTSQSFTKLQNKA